MTIKSIPYRVELTFWSLVIPMMTESEFFQLVLTQGYQTVSTCKNMISNQSKIKLAITGLLIGILIGVLSSL
jgi:hypothetical protein